MNSAVNMRDLREDCIVVTGGAGFLGQAVVRELQAMGCHDIVVPRSDEYDLRAEADVQRLYEQQDADVVIHLAAAVGGIGINQQCPGSFFYDNAIMGLQLMEHARRHDISKFVAIGTVCGYPKYCHVPFREADFWNGYPEETNAPYGLAKKMMLVQAQAYREQYGFNAIYLVPVNLYGPHDDFDHTTSHVIPAIMRKCIEAQETGEDHITLWGDGSPTREFLYVDDAARAIVQATQQYDDASPVNLGSSMELSIAEVAERIKGVTGFAGRIDWDASKPNGQPRRCLDTSRAKALFSFEASMPIETGLQTTYEWYLAHRAATQNPLLASTS